MLFGLNYEVMENEPHENSFSLSSTHSQAWNLSKLMAKWTTLRDEFEGENQYSSDLLSHRTQLQTAKVVNRKHFSSSAIFFFLRHIFWMNFVILKQCSCTTTFKCKKPSEMEIEIYEFILTFCDFFSRTNLDSSRGKRCSALTQTFYYEFRVQFMCLLHFLMGFYDVCNLSRKTNSLLCPQWNLWLCGRINVWICGKTGNCN